MLDIAPAFLPLQPLPASMHVSSSGPPSPLDLGEPLTSSADASSLAALRSSLALSLRIPPRARRDLDFVALPTSSPHSEHSRWEDELVVRQLKRTDVELAQRLQDACLPISYPPSFYTVLLTSPTSICLIAYSPSSPTSILGCISAHLAYSAPSALSASPSPPNPTVYLLSLAVDPSARGRGLAVHLIRSACRALLPSPPIPGVSHRAKIALHVAARNEPALRLYRRIGLREKRRQQGFYSRLQSGGNGEAVEMEGTVDI